MFIAELWRLLELHDLLWFLAPHLRVKDTMEDIGQGITLLVMKTCIYPFQVILAYLFNGNFRSFTSTNTLILLKYSSTNILTFCCFLIFVHGRNLNSLFVDDFRNVEHEHVWNFHDWCWHMWFPWWHHRTTLSKMAATGSFLSILQKSQWSGKEGDLQ